MTTLEFLHMPSGRRSGLLGPYPQVQVSFGLVRVNGQRLASLTNDLLWEYDGQVWTDFIVAGVMP